MESTSVAMKIHVSQFTKDLLGPNYKIAERGEIEVKGKGAMKTYWLEDREYRSKLIASSAIGNLKAIEAPPTPSSAIAINTDRKISYQDRRSSGKISANRKSAAPSATSTRPSATTTIVAIPIATAAAAAPKPATPIEERRIYSPVTFEDVAMRSVVNSPVRTIFSARNNRGKIHIS